MQGSHGFMSPQMQNIAKDEQSYVDLYYNDLYGLKCSINEFKEFYDQPRQEYFRQQKKQKQQFEDIFFVIRKQIYQSIYLFKHYLTLKYKDKQLSKQEYILYLKKVNALLNQIFQIYPKEQITTISSLVDKIQNRDNQYCLSYLLRCYGLTMELLYELNKLKSTSKIEQLKYRIKGDKQNDFIYKYKLEKLKKLRYISYRKQYEFSLEIRFTYYKYLQKQLNLSFKLKMFKILLQIFYAKIQTVQDYSTLKVLIQSIKQIYINQDLESNQDMFVFTLLTQIIMKGDTQETKNYFLLSKKQYPNSQQRLYRYLLKYHLANLDNNNQIIKYAKKLQKIYKQHKFYIKSYLWLVCQLAIAYQKINKRISMHYFEELRQIVNQYIRQLSQQQNQSQIINCYIYLGMYYQAHQLFQKSITYCEKQLLKIKQLYADYQIKQARCYIRMGRCFYRLDKLQEAEKYIKLAIEIVNFNNYYDEYSQMQDECKYLLCVISLLQSKQYMLIRYYNGLILDNIQNQRLKLKQDNQILFDNNLKILIIQNNMKYKLNYDWTLKQSIGQINQNKKEAESSLSNMKFQLKFIHHRRERYYLSQLVEVKKSEFLSEKQRYFNQIKNHLTTRQKKNQNSLQRKRGSSIMIHSCLQKNLSNFLKNQL